MAMIAQERDRVKARMDAGLGTTFDPVRLTALESVSSPGDIAVETTHALVRISRVLLDSPEGQEFFTLGLLKDIALSIAYTSRDQNSELAALGQQVADKIVHQLRGSKTRADHLLAAAEGLPNQDEIRRLVDRMKSSPGDDLLSFL
jgi:hypothetical protein